MTSIQRGMDDQNKRNDKLLKRARYLGRKVTSQVLPFHIDISATETLSQEDILLLEALQIEAAHTAVGALTTLSKINEVDHLGGGLELIPSLLLTMAVSDYEGIEYTIEHAHTSVGYYASLAAFGFVDVATVVDQFRQSIDIPGHVSWLPGGTQLNGGRLGVMIPVAVGQALGKRARLGSGVWVVTHCGDAGWISGQALNGFNGASAHGAPTTFIMHRNGIQLSGTTKSILDRDPRPVIESLGIEILEIPTLHDTAALYDAYRQGYRLAQQGKPNLIYPTGYGARDGEVADLNTFADQHGIRDEVAFFAGANSVAMNTPIWIPGSLMSYRDVKSMIECVFVVNQLPGGAAHHDGHMKGRDEQAVLANPMMRLSRRHKTALAKAHKRAKRTVVTTARPAPGSANLVLPPAVLRDIHLPEVGTSTSARGGSEAGYAAVAKTFPDDLFVVSCDLDPSTKLGVARQFLAADHQIEMSIEEQAAALVADGLAMSTRQPQLNVVSTFAAFYEGIAREGFDMWRYQRNLNGVNEGLNVTFHISHVGACTGRDHFSGWGLDWINIGFTYLPYLHRFYAPADARSAFVAVRDLAAHYGGHIIGIPRDDLPILAAQDGSPLWEADSAWETVTAFRRYEGASRAILALGAPAFVAAEAAKKLTAGGLPTDVHIVNGLPFGADELEGLLAHYTDGVVTIEDGFIGTPSTGVRGFAALVGSVAAGAGLPVAHVGITDPRTAPADGHMETWAHFGITKEAVVAAAKQL